MTQVKRIYVEKKPEYAVAAQDLLNDIHSYLDIQSVTGVRVLIRYDIENITETTYESAKVIVFSEPPVDILYEEELPKTEDEKVFSVEFEKLKADIAARDKADSEREISPLVQAEDAELLDTSDMSIDEVVQAILDRCK